MIPADALDIAHSVYKTLLNHTSDGHQDDRRVGGGVGVVDERTQDGHMVACDPPFETGRRRARCGTPQSIRPPFRGSSTSVVAVLCKVPTMTLAPGLGQATAVRTEDSQPHIVCCYCDKTRPL